MKEGSGFVIRDFHISGSEVDGYCLVLELDSSNNAEIPEVLRGHLVSEARNSSVILDLPPESLYQTSCLLCLKR